MSDENLDAMATRVESLLPRLIRRLFTLDADHPVTEMPVAQLRVCAILEAGPRSLSAISEEVGVSVSAATQLADRLERSGMVERVAEKDDRRMKRLQLTPHGDAVMRSRREFRIRRVAEAFQQMPPSAQADVLSALEVFLDAAIAVAPPPLRDDPVGTRLEN